MKDDVNHDLTLEYRSIDKSIGYARNARTHSDEQVAEIAASIREFGWTNPILVDGDNGVIAGHGRILAARKLGIDKVPVIELAHMTPIQKQAYIIADNKLALNAGWDNAMLSLDLKDLQEAGYDLGLTGFHSDELESLMDETSEGLTDEDAVPEAPAEPVTKPGDIYVLGNHRLLCGDSTVLANVEKVLDGALADMAFTDPPYNVNYANTPKDKQRGKNRAILNDNLGEGFETFLYDACVNILTVCKGAVYICMSSSELHTLQKAFIAAGGKWSTFVIWAKNTFTLARKNVKSVLLDVSA
jgi:hypothetical protein